MKKSGWELVLGCFMVLLGFTFIAIQLMKVDTWYIAGFTIYSGGIFWLVNGCLDRGYEHGHE
jgi:hypothetical protein